MNPITLSISLALGATPEQAAQAIDAINKFCGIDTTPGVAPAALVPNALAHLPVAQQTAAPAAQQTATTDKTGLPWDERIHSGSKALNADGTWRARKGVNAASKALIEAELRATLGATAPAAPAVAATPTLPMPPAAVAPTMPPMPGANVETPFTRLVKYLAENTQSPENPNAPVNTEWVKEVMTNFGVPNGDMQNLAHNLELCTTIENAVRGALGHPAV